MRTGRPREVMTDEAVELILRCVSLGFSPHRAAQAAGVKPSTLRARVRRDPDFATALEKAGAGAEVDLLARVISHSEKQWTACAWVLERRWPQRWARRDRTDSQRPNANDARALLTTLHEIRANANGAEPQAGNVA